MSRGSADAAAGVLEENSWFKAPDDLVCPITHAVFRSPVITTVGTVYEESAIRLHMQRSLVDPLTSQRIGDQVTPVIFLRAKANEYARTTATKCVERVFSPDCAEPERYLRRAYDLIDEAVVLVRSSVTVPDRTTNAHLRDSNTLSFVQAYHKFYTLEKNTSLSKFLPAARIGITGIQRLPANVETRSRQRLFRNCSHGTLPSSHIGPSATADLQLLFCYALRLAEIASESINDAASFAAYLLHRTGNTAAAGHLLRTCIAHGWPEPPPPPHSPSHSGTTTAPRPTRGNVGLTHVHRARSIASIDMPDCYARQEPGFEDAVHAAAASSHASLSTAADGSINASTCEFTHACDPSLQSPGCSASSSQEPPPRHMHGHPRPQDQAFADDAVEFILSQRWLRTCTDKFLTILMVDAGVPPATITAICQGLLSAAARGTAHSTAPQRAPQAPGTVPASAMQTVALLRVLAEPGPAAGCSCGTCSHPQGGVSLSVGAVRPCEARLCCGRCGRGISRSAAAEEVRRRLDRDQVALQAVPALLEARDRERDSTTAKERSRSWSSAAPASSRPRSDGSSARGTRSAAEVCRVRTRSDAKMALCFLMVIAVCHGLYTFWQWVIAFKDLYNFLAGSFAETRAANRDWQSASSSGKEL